MTRPINRLPQLNDYQRNHICSVLAFGGDRDMATKCVGSTPLKLQQEMARDRNFAAEVIRAEGLSETGQMQAVIKASKDTKNWRAAIWWLERQSPERFGRRVAHSYTSQEFQEFILQMTHAIDETIHDPADRERLIAMLAALGDSLSNSNRCAVPPPANEPSDAPRLLTQEADEFESDDP
jgi:hypothetical protein